MKCIWLYCICSILVAHQWAEGFRSVRHSEGWLCMAPKGDEGNCIPIKKCDSLMTLLRKERNKPETRQLLIASKCGSTNNRPLVCCPKLPDPPYCGCSDNLENPKIAGGQPSELGVWPWMAALGYRNATNPGPFWRCGGVLITIRHVLTAAHCIQTSKAELFTVRLGDVDLANNTDGATPFESNIERTFVHERYQQKRIHDIGLIKLSQNAPITHHIKPICLPKTRHLLEMSYVNYHPFVTGWGMRKLKGPFSDQLFEVQVPVISNQDCNRIYRRYLKPSISSGELCAGDLEGVRDACSGDSGSPLMWPEQGVYYSIGIVSFGSVCARPGFPGIYTRVTSYVDWIMNKID